MHKIWCRRVLVSRKFLNSSPWGTNEIWGTLNILCRTSRWIRFRESNICRLLREMLVWLSSLSRFNSSVASYRALSPWSDMCLSPNVPSRDLNCKGAPIDRPHHSYHSRQSIYAGLLLFSAIQTHKENEPGSSYKQGDPHSSSSL